MSFSGVSSYAAARRRTAPATQRPCAVPRKHVTEELRADLSEQVRDEPDGAPDEQVAGREQERSSERSRVLQLRVERDSRCD
jgi:hypothetical protein